MIFAAIADVHGNHLALEAVLDDIRRQGITEIRHVEGYFAYWDGLIADHPGMLIDSCASSRPLLMRKRYCVLLVSLITTVGKHATSW